MAAGLADEVAHHREPEAGAAAGLLGREERLEHASQHVVRHAAAGVGHGDGHERSGDRGVVRDVPAGQARAAGRDGDRPAVGHRIARVDGEIDDGLLQLAGVDPRDERIGRLPDVDDDVAEQAVEHGLERVHGRPDVDDRRLERRPPREREQLARELARPVDDVDDGRGIRRGPRRGRSVSSPISVANPPMAVSVLLKSWAMPPATRPIASRRSAWASCASSATRSVTSASWPARPSGWPWPSRRTEP